MTPPAAAMPVTFTAPPRIAWWRGRSAQVALLLHVLYLFGLCQLHMSNAELDRALGPSTSERSASAVISRIGALGVVRLYFGVHEPVELYHRYAEAALRGRDPKRAADDPQQGHLTAYGDVPIEYQPGKLALMLPPGSFSSRYEVYLPCFVIWSGSLYLAAVLGAWRLLGDDTPGQAGRVLWWSLAILVLFGPYAGAHLDQAVALVCVLGWWLFERARQTGHALWLLALGSVIAFGVLIKVAPGVLLPAVTIAWFATRSVRRWRGAGLVLVGFVLTLGLLHALFVAQWGDGYVASYTFHLKRGIQIESTWAGVLIALRDVLGPLSSVYNFGSYHLVTPYTRLVGILFPLTFGCVIGLAAWRVWRCRTDVTPREVLPVLTLVLLLALVVTSKVFSFNYLLWLTPILPVVAGRDSRWMPAATLFAGALALTQLFRLYDYAYAKLTLPWPVVALINSRNLVLLALLVWLVWRLPLLLRPLPDSTASRPGAA